jgi:hypothetical protein
VANMNEYIPAITPESQAAYDRGLRENVDTQVVWMKLSRSCNRHNDCEKAEENAKRNGQTNFINFHCHDDECPDCFGC